MSPIAFWLLLGWQMSVGLSGYMLAQKQWGWLVAAAVVGMVIGAVRDLYLMGRLS